MPTYHLQILVKWDDTCGEWIPHRGRCSPTPFDSSNTSYWRRDMQSRSTDELWLLNGTSEPAGSKQVYHNVSGAINPQTIADSVWGYASLLVRQCHSDVTTNNWHEGY